MSETLPILEARVARTETEVEQAQRLRQKIFLNGDGRVPEIDRFDAHAIHLILIDHQVARAPKIVATTRLLDEVAAKRAGSFYTETEFDIAALRRSGRVLAEVGRTCLDPTYRNTLALHQLWAALAVECRRLGSEVLMGAASLPGTDLAALDLPLRLLQSEFAADPALSPRPLRALRHVSRAPLSPEQRAQAVKSLPPLVKSYLKMGARVGQGVAVDPHFGVSDVAILLDLASSHLAGYARLLKGMDAGELGSEGHSPACGVAA